VTKPGGHFEPGRENPDELRRRALENAAVQNGATFAEQARLARSNEQYRQAQLVEQREAQERRRQAEEAFRNWQRTAPGLSGTAQQPGSASSDRPPTRRGPTPGAGWPRPEQSGSSGLRNDPRVAEREARLREQREAGRDGDQSRKRGA
jgi:hypothetical protein